MAAATINSRSVSNGTAAELRRQIASLQQQIEDDKHEHIRLLKLRDEGQDELETEMNNVKVRTCTTCTMIMANPHKPHVDISNHLDEWSVIERVKDCSRSVY